MTRKKYLQECANSYLAKTYESLDSCDIEFINCIIDAFEAGAKWADANPNSGVVDLSQVWHNIYEIPVNKNRLILFCDKYNCIRLEFIPYDVVNHLTQRMWNWYVENESFVAWAYVDDLLPRGGNEKDMK